MAEIAAPEQAIFPTEGAAVEAIGWSARVLPADEAGLKAYEAFCAGACWAPPQSPLWAKAWLYDADENGVIALLFRDGAPAMALALEVVRKGFVRVARFAGGSHANGNFPALHPSAGPERGDPSAVRSLLQGVRAARPDIDMLALERQMESLGNHPNPLLTLPHTQSPNLALAADLTGGFDRLLSRSSKDRRRKKYRSQLRKFEAAGGYRRFEASSAAEVDNLLDLFFRFKGERLKRMGVADTFASPHVRESFRRLFRAALDTQPSPFALHALEVGGKIRAITGSSRSGDRIICEFGAFAEDELTKVAPGDFLSYQNIAEACAEGVALYDFGVGDEPYKRAWCDIEIRHADVFVGLTRRGRALAMTNFAKTAAKRMVKQNPTLARIARRARQVLGRG